MAPLAHGCVLCLYVGVAGYYMRNLMLDDSPAQEYLYDLHKSVGVTLFVLLVVHQSVRLLTRLPDLPSRLSGAER
ncbi:MAG: hypothetical protein AAF732_05920 [Pseudomonadota bacterium]